MAESERTEESVLTNHTLPDGRTLPLDYTSEDAYLATLLNDLFDVEGELLPPRYAQTLLGEPRHAPASDDFEDRIAQSVFRQLNLTRTNLSPVVRRKVRRHPMRDQMRRMTQRLGRQAVTAMLAGMILLSLNVVGTGAALAKVLQMMVGHTGVQYVAHYPTQVAQTNTPGTPDYALHFLPVWPQHDVNGFAFVNMDVYKAKWWSDGALLDLHYQQVTGATTYHLDVFEFLPHTNDALQVVPVGAVAETVPVKHTSGIFVTGHWVNRHQNQVWQSGERAELITSGITTDSKLVVWIATDKVVDGTAAKQNLVGVANQLVPFGDIEVPPTPENLHTLSGTMAASLNNLFGNDVIALIGNASAPSSSVLYIPLNPDSARPGTNPSHNNR